MNERATGEPTGRGVNDVEAHERAMSADMRDVVTALSAMLGATTVAQIGGVHETRAVQQWMRERDPQRPHVLRFAFQLALMISPQNDGKVASSWFHGSNPHLDGAAPAQLLRDRPLREVQGPLLLAARSFAARS